MTGTGFELEFVFVFELGLIKRIQGLLKNARGLRRGCLQVFAGGLGASLGLKKLPGDQGRSWGAPGWRGFSPPPLYAV